MSDSTIVNIVIAGLGGQGVLRASDILAETAFLAGRDVKKAEVHGMSQRGGSVNSDVRYGRTVLSPMIPDGEADILLVLEPTQVEPNQHRLKPGGQLLTPEIINLDVLPSAKALNVAMLGRLSQELDLPEEAWQEALQNNFPEPLWEPNRAAFVLGRTL